MLPPPLPRIIDYVRWYAERTPQAEAAVLDDMRISYAELDRRVDRMAKAIMASGIDIGDRVATLATPSPDYLVAYLATTSVGAIWAGLNPKYRHDELMHIIRDCAPRLILTRLQIGTRTYADEVAAMRDEVGVETLVAFDGETEGVLALDRFLARSDSISDAMLAGRRELVGGRQACLLVYTSGSTGKPKGAVLHQQGIVEFSLAQSRIWPLAPNRSLNYFPINHVGCTVDLATPCLVAGGCTIFMEQFDVSASLDIMAREAITFWGAPPSVFVLQLAELDRRPRDLSAVQLIVWEGAAIPEDAYDRLAAFGLPMATNYGMTESTSAMTGTPPGRDRDILLHTVGPAFPGVEVRLADTDGNDVPDGMPGEVLARSPLNFLGYWNRPEATAETLAADGFLHTGDLAIRRPDGNYRIVGRLKEMYKSGGYNVYPREVEAVLEAHPAVVEAVVVAIPDPLWQEVGVAYVTLSQDATIDALGDWARDRLANYKIPKRFFIETELPLLPIGKVDRAALKRRAIEPAD